MKLLLSSLLILTIILAVGVSQAYADVSIKIDKNVYEQGDTISVAGLISDDYEYNPRNAITVGIYDLNGDREFSDSFPVNDENMFSVELPTSMLDDSGDYFVRALYGVDDAFDTASFTFVKPEPQEPTPEQIFSINPIADIEKRVTDLENKNKELLIENRDLKNEIKSMNERIDDLLSIVQEQIKVMLANFS